MKNDSQLIWESGEFLFAFENISLQFKNKDDISQINEHVETLLSPNPAKIETVNPVIANI